MNLLTSITQIREHQAAIRQKRLGYITNFYLDEFKHGIWIEEHVFFCKEYDCCTFFIKKEHTFWNVFYTCASIDILLDALIKLREDFPDREFILDIVGKESQCSTIVLKLTSIGCSVLTSLVRMSKITDSAYYERNGNVQYASAADIDLVYNYLHKYFDEKTEQLPFFKELTAYYHDDKILVYKDGGETLGFLIYEGSKTTNYLRYWFTHPDFRDKKVGSSLLKEFFSLGKDTKRQLFWVIVSNDNAIKRYRHYGFMEEDMFDYVLSLK